MKILKIVLVILIPAIAFVGCKKSDMKPGGCNHSEKSQPAQPSSRVSDAAKPVSAMNISSDVTDNTQQSETIPNANKEAPVVTTTNNTSEIYGSGDDDRDGGDKKQKKAAK